MPQRDCATVGIHLFAVIRQAEGARAGQRLRGDGTFLHSAPSTDSRNQLGYDDGTRVGNGSGNAAIDNIVCDGGTGTPEAISVAYNELYKVNPPGA